MCGINGFFNYSSANLGDEQDLIIKMNSKIRHRGPDDSGVWINKNQNVFLGHQRLSIIDLSELAHQPMTNQTGLTIVFNGEIYNYQELYDSLGEYQFKSKSDTEVLLNLYDKYKEGCLQYLNGMFAFAIWDSKKENLFLAKDRVGKKPLYYTSLNGIFAFSSEIKSLLCLPWIKSELDETALYHFLTFNFVPSPLTMFKGIYKIPPSHFIVIDKLGNIQLKKYWDINYQDFSGKNEMEIINNLQEELGKAVNYRMVSDVPVGAFLSGGVDSSAIVAMMSKYSNASIKTYSVGFKDQPDYDELKYAEIVSKKFNTNHFEKIVSYEDIIHFLPKIIEVFDEPLADSTCIPIYFISELARKNDSIVVLTGDGSDELFAGYRNWKRYIQLYPFYRMYQKTPKFLRKLITSTYRLIDESSPVYEMLNRADNDQEFFWGNARSFKESIKSNFLKDEYNRRNSGLNSADIISQFKNDFEKSAMVKNNFSSIDWMCYIGIKMVVPNIWLYRADRMGMAHSIEIRSPFLDYNLINYALSIPAKFKIQNKTPKYILKKSLENILPFEILYRKKMGFCVPLKEWASPIMLDYIESNLKLFCDQTDVFNRDGLLNLINRLKHGQENSVNNLWTVYFLMNWFNKWIK